MTPLVIVTDREWESPVWNRDAVYCLGMSRHCERPGCSKMGEVIYSVDIPRLFVTINFPDLNDLTPVNLLCRRHADSLVVPRGWTVIDNREERQRLFSAPITQEIIKSNPRRVDRQQDISEVLEPKERTDDAAAPATAANLFDFVNDEVVFETTDRESTDVTAELAQLLDTKATEALPWTPQFDRSGDLDGKLRARGRLLGRAFGHFEESSQTSETSLDLVDSDHDQSHPEY